LWKRIGERGGRMGPVFALSVRWATIAGWLFWFLVYWKGGVRVVADVLKAMEAGHPPLDRLLLVGMALLSPLPVLAGVLINLGAVEAPRWSHAAPVVLLGCGMSWVGVAGTFYCRRYLGRFWTAEAALMGGHRVVDSGPYGVVRHPIYGFALVMYAGAAVEFPVWWSAMACGLVMLGYVLKAAEEDRFLAAHLAGYPEYRRRVRYRLLPWVW